MYIFVCFIFLFLQLPNQVILDSDNPSKIFNNYIKKKIKGNISSEFYVCPIAWQRFQFSGFTQEWFTYSLYWFYRRQILCRLVIVMPLVKLIIFGNIYLRCYMISNININNMLKLYALYFISVQWQHHTAITTLYMLHSYNKHYKTSMTSGILE